jgi:putative ABC transport system substrate-binding protein
MRTIGFLSSAAPGPLAPFVAAFKDGLAEAGYGEGQNVAIEYRWAEGRYERLPALAAELVARKVDVIVASGGTPSARAAKQVNSRIPVVFTAVSDPVAAGIVDSLARPGGHVTGFSIMGTELVPKRLEMLFELLPHADTVAVLLNPNAEISDAVVSRVEQLAAGKTVRLRILKAATEAEIDAAAAQLPELRASGLLVADDAFFTNRREQIVALAARYAIPAIYQWRDFVVAGGLVSYGVSLAALYRLTGGRVARILQGAKPADLPIEQPAIFELVVNLKTAKALGLEIPASFLYRANEVIE